MKNSGGGGDNENIDFNIDLRLNEGHGEYSNNILNKNNNHININNNDIQSDDENILNNN